jgi:molecular chaperone DnaK (HSP70)
MTSNIELSSEIGIGIDLGTCNSCVSLYNDGKYTMVTDDLGNTVIPTSVLFLENEILYGETANTVGVSYPKNLIKDIKRIIGKTTLDSVLYYNKQHCYDMQEVGSVININIAHSDYTVTVTPDEIMGLYFSYLRSLIGKYITLESSQHINAVITIPAYFTENQRVATIKAAQIAKINVVRLINEPTAASLSYLHTCEVADNENNIIFDMGGGTLDVTLLNVNNKNINDNNEELVQVLATTGDSNLGGNDFNKEIMLYFFKEIKQITPSINLQECVTTPKLIHKILKACEIAKIELSTSLSANIYVEELLGADYSVKITRSTFDNLCNKYFNKCIELIRNVIKDASLTINDINNIILVGGPSATPQLSNIIKNTFNINPKTLSDPKYSVCKGAAIHCYNLINKFCKLNKKVTQELLVIDVTPLKIGVAVNDTMCTIIDKNTKIPCSASQIFSTEIDNQRVVTIKVYQGNNDLIKYNEFIGKLRITNIPAMQKREPKILVKFNLDCSGTLTVTAKELVSGGTQVSAVFDNKKYNIPEYDNFTSGDNILVFRGCYLKKSINDFISSMNKYLSNEEYRSTITNAQIIHLTELLNTLKIKASEAFYEDIESIKEMTKIYEDYKVLITNVINLIVTGN